MKSYVFHIDCYDGHSNGPLQTTIFQTLNVENDPIHNFQTPKYKIHNNILNTTMSFL